MGGSRRKLKKNVPKQRVGVVKRKKTEKAKLPVELAENRPSLEKRLKTSGTWDAHHTLITNYKDNKLAINPNEGFGRNIKELPLKPKEELEELGEETYSDDDELRAACNLERKSGKAKPPRLTSHQRQIIQALIDKHGEDVQAMVMDIKLNSFQHSAGQLKKLIEAYRYWRPEDKHDFRAPQKRFKRL